MTPTRRISVYYFCIYLFGFLLFWEWLRPLEVVTDTANSHFFVIFSALSFLLYYLKLPFWLAFVLRIVGIFYILHSIFFEGSFIQFEWLLQFYFEIVDNVVYIASFKWWEMSDLFRSFLFLFLLWLMCYLVHYWLIHIKSIAIFFILTLLFVTILDTFTKYDASVAIVRIVITGFLVLGMLQMLQIKEKVGVSIRPFWIISLLIMIGISVTIGLMLPKQGPYWPDPVPFIKSAAGGYNGTAINKIGYGVDDSRLGGSFVNDDSVVFTAEVSEDHYWRVESKDYYTGKGWEVSEEYGRLLLDKSNIHLNMLENVNVDKKLKTNINIAKMGPHSHIVYPTDLKSIQTDKKVEFQVEPLTGKLHATLNGSPTELAQYSMTYDYPEFPLAALRLANEGDRSSIMETYTQLPEQLPNRVKELAIEITKDLTTRYDKAKAVEGYFSSQGFAYATKDIPVPKEDQDYVDQFLFETRKGYCDNFSTSMVVLLRAVDIPARWVKGYTQGDFVKSINSETNLYEVKNSNAHSWVEVYFPGIGWVPFEPTQGFLSPYSFVQNGETLVNSEAEETFLQEEGQNENDEMAEEEIENNTTIESSNRGALQQLGLSLRQIIISIVILFLLTAVILKTKRRWYPRWIIFNYRYFNKNHRFENTFRILVKLLDYYGLPINKGETLREYGVRVDETLGTSEMRDITNIYEKMLYSQYQNGVEQQSDLNEYLKYLVRKITS
ncbi:transglutaminase TgpA family protein [Bacillus sp. Marseille-P3661]|uniref:transglutaminase TgpA family protein n=1 Tax=Bacillus sp. Marseille-P3661 TaxID=1936234 RepID=UPI000C83E6CA|nr:transglutaminaseTgpA domain-containing protein [Bacillus sp. Marseille-P3661]